MNDSDSDTSWREKVDAVKQIATYKPRFTVAIVIFGVGVALLEGIGLGFLLPIIELAQNGGQGNETSGLLTVFVQVYQAIGVELTLETAIVGVAIVMLVRYSFSFIADWLRELLRLRYTREIQQRVFDHTLKARIDFFDSEGSDDIINTIITETKYAGQTIKGFVQFFETILLVLVYAGIAIYLSPKLTLLAGTLFVGLTYVIRYGIEPAYAVGDRRADANEQLQETAQAGTQGIRDIKLFGMREEVYQKYKEATEKWARSSLAIKRNQLAINNVYRLLTAVLVFVLIYVLITFSSLSFAEIGVFLFATFRLTPKVSNLNTIAYRIESNLPHFIRTSRFVDELESNREPRDGDEPVPDPVSRVAFEDVTFSYEEDNQVLDGVSFSVENGEFIAFVGKSGAGKSTIVSLLSRMYTPDSGQITANGTRIGDFDIEEWRSHIAVVRQQPFIFNDTLRYNLTIGNRKVSETEMQRVADIANIIEFLDDLPDGFNTVLGDNGVQLSGGQRQRVAIARALLKDADVLVLDEATSDLDSNIESDVQTAIEEMERDFAIIAIAHRLSTIKNADCIYTLENGQIVEKGTHQALLENDQMYADLYTGQQIV